MRCGQQTRQMNGMNIRRILTINSGSSSIKSALFDVGQNSPVFTARLDRIGLRDGVFRVQRADESVLVDRSLVLNDHDVALQALLEWLKEHPDAYELDAVGHRVVHGGSKFVEPCRTTSEMVDALRELVPLAPNHLPNEIKAIDGIGRAYPSLPQVACFDTAFHRSMPTVAQTYPLPADLRQAGLLRYGFHGLSYEFIVDELRRDAGSNSVGGRVVIAHLGSGASMVAVRDGKSVDTTMGFTPAGGLVMGARSGDLDPGVLLYLLRQKGLSADQIDRLVNHQCGLLGVSGVSSDMRDLLAEEQNNSQAAAAVELFCYQARKFLAAMTAALGGLDELVFTAGIGERSAAIRYRICSGLGYLGIRVDSNRNESNTAVISPDDSPVTVRVLPTNEELMIAKHTRDVLG